MVVKQFRNIDWKIKGIIYSALLLLLLFIVFVIYRSYAIYQEQQNFNVIHGSVPEYDSEFDVKFVLTIDGERANVVPSKDSGKVVESVFCDKNAKGYWDYENWRIIVDFQNVRTKCQVNFVTKYRDSVLNGADPILKDGLIPVTINESGHVYKADLRESWYRYEEKVWANAVILEDENVTYQNNEEIPEDNIESYFVWIPRYRYQLFNSGNFSSLTSLNANAKREIEVVFETKDIPESSGTKAGEWLTPRAFTSFDVNGMWAGKFETGYKGAMTTKEAEQNVVDTEKIQVKPNVYSWRNMNVATAHLNSFEYKREYDSHMMKNTEWGAVAYLSHSKYGSMGSVRNNNNSAYITGYAAVSEPTSGNSAANVAGNMQESTELGVDGTYTINYKSPDSVVASTTGNYSGIYDMSGGSWEYVMGVMISQNGKLISGYTDNYNSNFVGILTTPSAGSNTNKSTWTEADGGVIYPLEKYYDKYTYSKEETNFQRCILSDATGEMGPFAYKTYSSSQVQVGSWYDDEAFFVTDNAPWLARGGRVISGTRAGIFSFHHNHGHPREFNSYRIVLAF